jgi:hypothetical protein
MVTATVPLEVTVTDFVTAVPTATLLKASELALRLRVGVAAFSCSAALFDEEFALAATLTVCDVVTEATVAVNEAFDAPEATITLVGTVTELPPLATATFTPLEGAAKLNETVHAVVPAPVNVVLAHDNALTVGTPGAFSCNATLFDDEFALAMTVTVCDVVTEATVAVNEAFDAPEATVTLAGTVTALPPFATATLTPLEGAAILNDTVHAVVPAPVNVVLAHDNALTVGTPGAFSFSAKLFDEEFALAVNVAVCEVVTEATFAVNDAADAPEATDTLAGTVTAPLLLARVTLTPVDGADALNDTVHDVVPALVNVLLPQDNALTVGVTVAAFSCSVKLFEEEFELAVTVAVCVVPTEATLALKEALEAPPATVTLAGTVRALALLDSVTLWPPV